MRQLSAAQAFSANMMFELTESSLVEDIENVSAYIKALRKRGHKISLDDFGAGANAYNYLRSFDADFVKIDGPFLKSALTDDRQRALVKSIVLLCHELGIEMIGEMIETEQMSQAAASLGIEYGQGYLFGKPQASLIAPSQNLRRKGERETWQ
jgi:EAL domain-containing protein (putative c-di-GMP-specific phosphodiesterase class I)